MKLVLCTLAAILLIGTFTVHPADAACWWNGWGWQCWHPHYYRWAYGHPVLAWRLGLAPLAPLVACCH